MKSVRYSSYSKLTGCLPVDVVMCVNPSTTPAGAPFIEGRCVAIDVQNDALGRVLYVHSLTYEESQLLNPDGLLAECDITGVFCRGCLTRYVDYVAMVGVVAPSEAVFQPLVSVPFGSIGAAYALAVDLPNGTKGLILDNQTNGDVFISMDGGVHDTYHVKGGDKLSLNLSQFNLVSTAQIYLRQGALVPTTGTFYIYSVL